MNKNYVKENEELLQRWEASNNSNHGENNFSHDGIMYLGDINQCNGIYYREPSEDGKRENDSWSSAKPRILFVTKDQNAGGEDSWDIRTEIGRKDINYDSIQLAFFRNLMYQLYGIYNTTETNKPDYCFSNHDAIKLYDQLPHARINVKKEAGCSSIDNGTLQYYLNRDANFIAEQIKILDPDIMICCGYSESVEDTGNLILNFIKHNVYNVQPVDNKGWMFYDQTTNKLAINNWHLSVRKSSEEIYTELVDAYYNFIHETPSFLEKIRNRR